MADGGQNGLVQKDSLTAMPFDQRARTLLLNMRQRVMAIQPRQRGWLIAALILLIAVSAAGVWMVTRPDMRMLLTGLDPKDTQQITQQLAGAGVSYEMTADGAGIRVPAEQLDKARMEIAAKGMPQTGRLGFELFDKPNWVGSEFDEKVNYQRALEGELEHTIETIAAVKSARVHLVLPKESLFAQEEHAAKATVVLKLKRSSLRQEEIDSIRNLVAGAVENLQPAQVTLVDADGRMNLRAESGHAGGREEQGMAEAALQEKIIAVLEPLAGAENVRATVNVSYDQSTEEQTDEIYDPDKTVAVSMQRSEQTAAAAGSASIAKAGGVPGTASNTPEAAPEKSMQANAGTVPPLYPQASQGGQTVREESGSYAVTKHLLHKEEGPGRIRRITAAVVVNDRPVNEGAGKSERTVWKPRSADEMKRLEGLAQAAIGLDAARGDQLTVENVGFSGNMQERPAPIYQRVMEQVRAQPGLLRLAATVLGGVLLLLFVLRPVAKQVSAALNAPMEQRMLGEGSPGLARARHALMEPVEEGYEEELSGFGEELHVTPQQRFRNSFQGSFAEQDRFTPSHDSLHPLASRHDPARERVEVEDERPIRQRVRQAPSMRGVFDRVSGEVQRDPAQSTRLLEGWMNGREGDI